MGVEQENLKEILNRHKDGTFYDNVQITFGKYKGKDLKFIVDNDKQYLIWLTVSNVNRRLDVNARKAVKGLVERITTEKALVSKIPFGKHKGKTLAEVSKAHPSYLTWLAKNNVKCPILRRKIELITLK